MGVLHEEEPLVATLDVSLERIIAEAKGAPVLAREMSHLRRAEIHDAAGDRAQAAFHYRRFVDLWADADPELQPAVALARDRLRQIQPR